MQTPPPSPPQRLLNKVAIVTGASSGLGREISLLYAQHGAKVICADLRPTARSEIPSETTIATHDLIAQRGGTALFVPTDVGDEAQMAALVAAAVERFGRLDILVNNAGIAIEARMPARIHDTPVETWDVTMRVNARSVFLGCKYAVRQMMGQEPIGEGGDRGWIVNVASVLGLVGGDRNPSYCASKGAVSLLTKQVALDYAQDRIHVNAICPGFTQTAIFKETIEHMVKREDLERLHPFGGTGLPAEVARAALWLASEDAAWMTGVCLPVDGGYTAR